MNTLALTLSLLVPVPYIRAILRGETKPMKSTWLVWATLDWFTCWGMWQQESLNGQIVGVSIGATTIAVLAWRKGRTGWSLLDGACLTFCIVGIVLWRWSGNPDVSITLNLSVILVATLPTFRNAWRNPQNENWLSWLLAWCSCVSVMTTLDWSSLAQVAQPIVFFIIETTMLYLILIRPRIREE